MTVERPAGWRSWDPAPSFFEHWRPDQPTGQAAPWDDLLDGDDEDDDEWGTDDEAIEALLAPDAPTPSFIRRRPTPQDDQSEPTTSTTPADEAPTLTDDDDRTLFPATDIADEVEERVDDLIPDIDASGPREWEQALLIISNGLDRCAGLKQVATSGFFDPIQRELLRTIREEKKRLIALRAVYRERYEQHRRQWSATHPQPQPRPQHPPPSTWVGNETDTGFGWAATSTQKTDADYAQERRRVVDDTNEYISNLYEEMSEDRDLHRKRMDAIWRRGMFGPKYVVLAEEDFYDRP